MKNGHSPDAKGVVCVDFDGTLVPWGPLMNPESQPLPGAVEAVQKMKNAGWRILIYTSRLSPSWHSASGEKYEEQLQYVVDTLNRLGIPFDGITAEKVPAEAYIDDRAIEFTGDNWPEIAERMLR
jgi:hypothetical protein